MSKKDKDKKKRSNKTNSITYKNDTRSNSELEGIEIIILDNPTLPDLAYTIQVTSCKYAIQKL
jgi:hypothetical protein